MTLRFHFEWLDNVPADAALGPEADTWCQLAIEINGTIITRNHPADVWSRAELDFIEGPLSGIVEWAVEEWPYILWETHCPFPKSAVPGASIRVPSLRDASSLWADVHTRQTRNELATWQHRHTVGHGSSDLALPSLVLLPEDKRIGLFLDHIPRNLNPAVRFDSGWSPEPTWIVREDVQQELSNLVEATLKRAQSRASGEWATFVRARWAEKRAQAADEESRRSLLLGRFVSERWQTIKSAFGEGSSGIHSLLIDAEQVTSQEELRPILDLAPPVEATRKLRQWALVAGAAHDQGYELAAQARAFLGNQAEPVSDLPSTLREFDVELRDVPSNSFFSAVFSHGAGASILAVGTSPRKFGIAPTRFAIAAALGRLLAERTTDGPFGAAHSSQSRWINTQRANAFAAEFLLPVEAIGVDSSVETLCDAYGISRSAAAWHVHNRRRI